MTTSAPPGFVVRDLVPLPAPDAVLCARAVRDESYPIFVVRSLERLLELLVEQLDGAAVALVTDETVEALYAGELVAGLRDAGVEVIACSMPAGERSKSLERAVELWDWLARSPIGRRDVLLNLGGGVVTDLGGWVASGYMRGLPYINLPTTLLAQVDGALGGKVAANHQLAKNLLGAFHQPAAVISNVGFLASTSTRHLAAGLAEVIKKAVIASPECWRFIDESTDALFARDPDALQQLVRAASAIKTELVQRDPYELDLRRPLNFGHTVGHPLETVTGYGPLLHGEAVAFGMVVESRIAVGRGLLDEEVLDQLIGLLERCGLPTRAADLPAPVDGRALVEAMEKVRLIRAGSLRFVLPRALGETVIADTVGEDEIGDALRASGVRLAV
ncbi:MAG: 3-dehydroquinate synthase [Solirubrobacteraceae bacterium]